MSIKWKNLLFTKSLFFKPGFIGRVPYLLMLRVLIILGILLRFYFHQNEIRGARFIILVLSIIAMLVLLFIAIYATYRLKQQRAHNTQILLIISDVTLLSIVYFLTGNLQSDFFLFYYLPILIAAEYLDVFGMAVAFVAITCVFLATLIVMELLHLSLNPMPVLYMLFTVFLPKEVFFLGIAVLSSGLHQMDRIQNKRFNEKQYLMGKVLRFKTRLDKTFELDQIYQITIQEAVKLSKADNGHILIPNRKTERLELKIPYHTNTFSTFLEDEAVILAIEQKKPIVLEDLDSHPSLRALSDSRNQSLLYIPIISHNTLLCVIGVGSMVKNAFNKDTKQFLQIMAAQVAGAIEKAILLNSLHEIGGSTTGSLELNKEVDSLLYELTEMLGFEFATISIVDDYRQTIETIRGKNVPLGWVELAHHSLDSSDIQTMTVRNRETMILIGGWVGKVPDYLDVNKISTINIQSIDERLDPDIFERFNHKDLARVSTPLFDNGKVIGTIEAGCHIKKRVEILTVKTIEEVENLGKTCGPAIGQNRPHVLLEAIVERAIEIIGADSASIHVYQNQSSQPILEAWIGEKISEVFKKYSRRTDKSGIGEEAIQTGKLIVIDDPKKLANRNPIFYEYGIRAVAAFPFSLGVDAKGVLYVHFWREHRFSPTELELEEIFARQMELVIQNYLYLRNVSDFTTRFWTLSRLQNVIQALASKSDLIEILEAIAQNVLWHLPDADNVIIYQYNLERKEFTVPPVTKGSFKNPELIQYQVDSNSILWSILNKGYSLFFDDVSNEPILWGILKTDSGKRRFVEREEIKSSAVMLLTTTNEVVGIMFVNYRKPHMFNDEDKQTIITLASSAAIAIENVRLHMRLAEEQKLASWEDFTARIAHIIGTRLAVISGTITQLSSCLTEKTNREQLLEAQTFLNDLKSGMQKAQETLIELRKFVAPMEVKLKKIDIVKLLANVIKEIKDSINFSIEFNPPDKPIQILGDSLRLSDSFIELIKNAQEAMEQNTDKIPKMTIKVILKQRARNNTPSAQIEFIDTGPGISKEKKQKVFEPYFSSRGENKGLGLAIVKKTIEQHNGTIEETEEPGKGARFIIYLPITE